ncbi:MAG: hypothetical protein ACFFDQ_02105 [Candidatus Thorarchaeota archaeon]
MCVFLADSLDGDDESVKNCPKCGRANQPTRKYCIRCGGLLLSIEPKPKTISSPDDAEVIPEVKKTPPPATPVSEVRVTTNDQWVKPSSVARDRVRSSTGLSKPKSEMEKAKEAFARAEEVGIEETGEGIIETRMLRASEVQELMGDLESQRQAVEAKPAIQPPTAQSSVNAPPGAPGPPSMSAQPAKPMTPPGTTGPPSKPASPSKPMSPPGTPQPTPVQQPVSTPPEKPPTKPEMIATPEPKPVISTKPTPSTSLKSDITSKTRIAQVDTLMSEITDSSFLKDTTIRDSFNDLTNQYTELAQFQSDLDSVRSRLESEVRDYWNLAEVKRINFESLEEQMRLAKQEWTDTSKVFQTAQKRMDNELASREKRIKEIEKRIGKTEDTIRKRTKELEKEREKQAPS